MNAKDKQILDERKAEIDARLDPDYQPQRTRPIIGGASTRFEVSGRVQAVICGALESIHPMVRSIRLVAAIPARLIVFKRHWRTSSPITS